MWSRCGLAVTVNGPNGRFERRAVPVAQQERRERTLDEHTHDRRNLPNAETAAREMGGLSLADALALCDVTEKNVTVPTSWS